MSTPQHRRFPNNCARFQATPWARPASVCVAIVAALLLVSGCKDRPAEEAQETLAPQGAEVLGPQQRWERDCASCHELKDFQALQVTHLRETIGSVEVMRRFEGMQDDELNALVGYVRKDFGTGDAYEFMSAEVCARCHPDHAAQWRQSLHAQAHSEPVYNHYFIKASQDSDKALEPFCARCHTPIAVLAGHIPFPHPLAQPEDTKVSPIESEGVQCDFCHVINGHTELANGGFTVAPSIVKRAQFNNAVTPFHGTERDEFTVSPEACGTCHNVNHPTNGIALESTYTEWKEGPWAAEGVTCMDCHMNRSLGDGGVNTKKAATKGPRRQHVSDHFFVGPTLLYADAEGAEELKALGEELLRRAGTVEVGAARWTDHGLTIDLLVTNTGTGHYLPTGVSEIRELWLEVKVTDLNGELIFTSGVPGEDGNLPPGTVVYRTEVHDATGRFTTRFWNAEKKFSDHRIAPHETLTESVTAPLAQPPNGPLTVAVALNYRSVSPFGLAEVGAAGLLQIPVFTIASDEREVDVR